MNTIFKVASAHDTPLNADDSATEFTESENTFFISAIPSAPTEHCFPIDPEGRLLVGAYPRDVNELKLLVEDGNVCCFVNLTSDRRYESWLDADMLAKVKFLYRPLPRRNFVGNDASVVSTGREIRKWLRSEAKQNQRIYVHSELGYGRAGVVASVLLGDLRNLQATASISLLEAMRAALRKDYEQEKIVPVVETPEQVQQVFRLLGNPQIDASGKQRIDDNDTLFADERKIRSSKKEGGGLDGGGARFVDVDSAGRGSESNTANGGNTDQNYEDDEEDEVPFGQDLEYAPLPDRSNTSAWMNSADGWIKERKKSRKALTKILEERLSDRGGPSKKRRTQ